MNRMHLYQEAIIMKGRRCGSFPEVFEWRGRDYRVRIVERCWTMTMGDGTRFRFRVRCSEGIFSLSYHPATDRWYIENVAAD
jgi:hypothetical protein